MTILFYWSKVQSILLIFQSGAIIPILKSVKIALLTGSLKNVSVSMRPVVQNAKQTGAVLSGMLGVRHPSQTENLKIMNLPGRFEIFSSLLGRQNSYPTVCFVWPASGPQLLEKDTAFA